MKRLFLYCLFTTPFFFLTVDAQVVINEFSAANYSDVTDNYGEYEDWIELYNTGTETVDLTGYHLSDRYSNPTKWQFPAGVSIAPGDHLIIWASKRDEYSGGHVHTRFSITQTRDNEAVVFADPTGVILDFNEIDFPNQTDHSYGRTTDGGDDWGLFLNPTPGNPNNTASPPYAVKPVFDMDPGYYSGSVTVTLSSPESGVSIYYTTNGDFPTESSSLYSSPLTISSTTVLRARAFSDEPAVPPSLVESNTYFIDDTHTVYIISIAGDQVDDLLNGAGWIDALGSCEIFNASGELLDEALGEFNEHGNDSWAYPHRGFDYIARDQFGDNYAINYPLFNLKERDSYQRLIIKAGANDNYPYEDGGAHIRDAYVHALSQHGNLKIDERTYEPAIVYVNGQYWGVYDMREKVDDSDFTDYYYNQDKYWIDFIKTWGGTWEEYGSIVDWDDLHNYILTNDMSVPANYEYVKDRLNVNSLMDYILLNTHTVCKDWLNWNTAWWRGRNPDGDKKKWRYALWDMDATFGHYINYTSIPDVTPYADPCDAEELDGGSDPEDHIGMLLSLYESEEFYDLYVNRYADLLNTIFSCDQMLGLLDSLILQIEPEMPGQIARWGGSLDEWQDNVDELRDFIMTRCAIIDEGIVDCYEVEGPYEIMFVVDPPLAGDIKINTITPTSYPWSGAYFGGVNMNLKANALPDFTFSHWELINNDVSPDLLLEEVSMDVNSTDTIIAHFNSGPVLPFYNLTVIVDPPTAGNVYINGLEPSEFPWFGAFTSGTTINLSASSNPGYTFEFWELFNQFVNPDPTVQDVFFALASQDTIIAHFREPSSTAIDDPETVGAIRVYPSVTVKDLNLDFNLVESSDIDIDLYSISGVKMGTLFSSENQQLPAGNYSQNYNLEDYRLAPGMYLVNFVAGDFVKSERIIYLQD